MSLHMRVGALFHPISLFHRVWPVTAIGAGLIASVVWTAFIAYGLFRLAF
jgi:hypothetical protein